MGKRIFVLVGMLGILLGLSRTVETAAWQAPTQTIPPLRAEAYNEDVNVRAGPGTYYDRVGTLVRGQSGAILGQARVGQYLWLKIIYIGGPDNEGWVLNDVVKVTGDLGMAPTIVAPPTPTHPAVPTLLIATAETGATTDAPRLPTFTAPPPLILPTLLPVQGVSDSGGFPPAILLISLTALGLAGGLVSLLRRR